MSKQDVQLTVQEHHIHINDALEHLERLSGAPTPKRYDPKRDPMRTRLNISMQQSHRQELARMILAQAMVTENTRRIRVLATALQEHEFPSHEEIELWETMSQYLHVARFGNGRFHPLYERVQKAIGSIRRPETFEPTVQYQQCLEALK